MKLFIQVRKLVYIVLGSFYKVFSLPHTEIFILCYHSISSDGWRFAIRLEEFKRQINYLKKEGYQFISLSELVDYFEDRRDISKPSVVITFDDGYKDILQVKNFLKNLDITPTLFVLSDTKNANRKELGTNRDFLSNEEVLGLVRSGWEIGSHTATHSDMGKLNHNQIFNEINDSKKILERQFALQIRYLAYPKGKYNSEILKAVKAAGYKLALTMDDGVINKQINCYSIPRIGVDGTHSFAEFKTLFLPLVIKFRGFLKEQGYGK